MAREFKPVRFFVMMALAAFVVCGVTSFYTHRAAHGRMDGLCNRVDNGRASPAGSKVANRC